MPYRIICFDMDGVIFKSSNFWIELHRIFGTLEEGKKLTEKYLYTDYGRLVKEVVGRLWKGKCAKEYYRLVNSYRYLPGVKKVFSHAKNKGYVTAIVSSSSMDVARRVQKEHGLDYIFANELIIINGRVTGDFVWPVGAGKENKADIIKSLCSSLKIPLKDCIFIGDSESDIEALKEVGLSIAFNPDSEKVSKSAKITVRAKSLAKIIKYI